MLIVPTNDNEKLVIVGIDPGTDTLGACVAEVDLTDAHHITVVATITFNGTLHIKHNRAYQELAKIHNAKYARLRALDDCLSDLFARYKPHLVCSESPFMHHSPHAFASLTEALTTIRQSLHTYNSDYSLFLVPPQMAKAAIGSTKNTDKKAGVKPALEALLNEPFNSGLYLGPGISLDDMSEHELDAIAVAYTRYANLNVLEKDKK